MKKRDCAAVVLLAALAGGCADTQERYMRDGVRYGVTEGVFRGRWWSYHERGVSFLNGGFYAEAVSDFQQALAGRSTDTWRARTYGLHFVEYFPNRELGVAYFHLGQLDDAETYLQRSLAQVDTARAHYYLDQITRARIESGQIVDEAPPALETTLGAAAIVAEPLLDFEIAAQDDVGVAEVVVSVAEIAPEPPKPAAAPPRPAPEAPKPAPVAEAPKPVAVAPQPAPEPPKPVEAPKPAPEPAKPTVAAVAPPAGPVTLPQRKSETDITFQKQVMLPEGTHEIEVQATDLAEKKETRRVEVTIDLTGPTIGVFAPIEPTITERGTIELEGASVDKNGVVAVNVGDRVVAEAPGVPRLEFFTELPLGDGENAFVLASRDIAGNETRASVKVFKGDPNSMEARLWLLRQHLERAPMRLASSAPIAISALLAQVEESPGEIRVKSPRPDRPYRHSRTLRIAGEVVAKTRVASIRINGEPVDPLTGAPKESFNKRIPIPAGALSDGSERITVAIEAQDASGATLRQTFDVDVRPVDLDSRESRMPVAVLAFGAQGVEDALAASLRAESENALFQQGRFQVVDRLRLQDVLTEQQLSAALGDPAQALSLGRLTPAQVFLVADVFGRDAAAVEVKARVVSTETGALVDTQDVFIADKADPAKVRQGVANLAAQLQDRFPRVSGEVVSVRGQDLLLNWTAEDGVREGAYVLLVAEEPPFIDEDTGEVLEPGEYRIVGRARITGVSDTGARARAVGELEGAALEQGMPAVTM